MALTARESAQYVDEFLVVQKANLVAAQMARHDTLKKKGVKTASWRQYPNWAVTDVPVLSPGVKPDPLDMTPVDVTADLVQIADWLPLNDVEWDLVGDRDKAEIKKRLKYLQANKNDFYIHGKIKGGTNVRYAGGVAARTSIVDFLDIGDINNAVATLEGNDVAKITEIIVAGTMISTVPVDPCYVAFFHPYMKPDIKDLNGFIPAKEYASQKTLFKEEFGAIDPVRFIPTTNVKVWADAGGTATTGARSTSGSANDVYYIQIFGDGYYGCVTVGGLNIENGYINTEIIQHDPGEAGALDALNQQGSFGFKNWQASKILDDDCGVRIEAACREE